MSVEKLNSIFSNFINADEFIDYFNFYNNKVIYYTDLNISQRNQVFDSIRKYHSFDDPIIIENISLDKKRMNKSSKDGVVLQANGIFNEKDKNGKIKIYNSCNFLSSIDLCIELQLIFWKDNIKPNMENL